MKALHEMDNLGKGTLLCKLFPEELENIQNVFKAQCEYFLKNETDFRNAWQQGGFFTAAFWYQLVHMTYQTLEKYQDKLWKRSSLFADHFFDGHRALFTTDCLIRYAVDEKCPTQLRLAIHLFFGEQPIIIIKQHP
jgi:hypothetical protein